MSPRTPRKGFSIVIKVALLAGSIAALASLIVGTLIVEGSSDIVYQNALNRLQYETNIKSLKLISDIRNLSGDAQYLVGTPPIKGIPRATHNGGIDPLDGSNLATWHDRLATIFSELIRAKPNYLQIRYIGIANNGRELVRVDRQGSLIRAIADEQLQQKGDTPYFKNAARVNLGEVYLSDINLNRELGKVSEPYIPVIRAATPVYFNDRLFGMLVINMSVRSLFEELIVNTPRELTPYITNEDGYFLAHPDNEMTYGFDLDNDHRIQSSYADLDLKQNKDIRDREFTVTFNDDVIHVVKAHYDPLQKQRFIAVMLATSNKNLQSGYDHLRLQNFFIMALLVVISLIIAALLASRLLRPLRLITIASDDLANGREVGNLPVEANDEIGELARSFADMYRQLEDKERELIVSQGRVHHMNKMASLGEMAATMAHEINSPIQTINLVAQRVQRQLKKDMSVQDIHASMDKIISGVNKTSEIIDSLRKISRDSEDDDYLEIHLSDLIEDVLNLTEERFRVNNVCFEVNYHDLSENTRIQCQHLQVTQVLINLINNAYDAIQALDEKWIRIDIQRYSDKIQFAITDSGPGIPPETVDRIFEPLFTTKDIGKGTGLGLSISRDIIDRHNGLLYIDNGSSNTRFIVELPIIHLKK